MNARAEPPGAVACVLARLRNLQSGASGWHGRHILELPVDIVRLDEKGRPA